MDYAKLTKNQITYLCRRYGHKKVIREDANHCARCGHKWAHEMEDKICLYWDRRLLKRMKAASEFCQSLNLKNPKASATLTFSKWKKLDT